MSRRTTQFFKNWALILAILGSIFLFVGILVVLGNFVHPVAAIVVFVLGLSALAAASM